MDDGLVKGDIVAYFPRQRRGWLVTDAGEERFFAVRELDVVGGYERLKQLSPGDRVGFDFSWAAMGLRICKLKVY